MDVNTVVLQGTIAAEPEAHFLASGTQETASRVKVTEVNRDGKEFATYVPISAYGRTGEALEALPVGTRVCISGKLAWRKGTEGNTGGLYIMVRSLDPERVAVSA